MDSLTMPITFECACGRQLQIADEYVGKRAQCPECGAVLQVPSADAPPPLPPPRPSPAKPLAQPARNIEPEEADDHAGTADSLDSFERRKPAFKRARLDDDEEEEERPRRRKREDDEDDDDRPRSRRHRYDDDDDRPRRRRRDEPPHKLMNNRVTGGIVSIVLALVIFGIGLALDRICFWPIIMLVIGVVSLITGLVTGRDE
jgi:hypothetical protein